MSLIEHALKKMQEQAKTRDGVRQHPEPSPVSRVPDAEVVQRASNVPPTPQRSVRIDYNALRKAELIPPSAHERQIGEQFRQIKRPLIANATGRGAARLPAGHLIMLASAVPGEGKTFTSINLAFSMAYEKDIRVLLVDADVAKPHITQLFGLSSEPGLLDALQDPALDIESLVFGTDVPGLCVLPAGQPSTHATELLASERMQQIAHRIGERDSHRVVLFDSPPLLLTTESQALAGAVGQIVLVVRAGVTSQRATLEAIERLGTGRQIAVVINQTVNAGADGYQKYYGQGTYSGGSPVHYGVSSATED